MSGCLLARRAGQPRRGKRCRAKCLLLLRQPGRQRGLLGVRSAGSPAVPRRSLRASTESGVETSESAPAAAAGELAARNTVTTSSTALAHRRRAIGFAAIAHAVAMNPGRAGEARARPRPRRGYNCATVWVSIIQVLNLSISTP
jgi:hypothetical protein